MEVANETASIAASADNIKLDNLEITAAWGTSAEEAKLAKLQQTEAGTGRLMAFNDQGVLVPVNNATGDNAGYQYATMTLTLTAATEDASQYQGQYEMFVYTSTVTNSVDDAVSRLRLSTQNDTNAHLYSNEATKAGGEDIAYISIRFVINSSGKLVKYVDGSSGDVVATTNADGISWTFYVSLEGQPSASQGDAYGTDGSNVDETLTGSLVASQTNPNED